MQLSDLRKACRGRYLGIYDDEEDARFKNALLDEWLNECHRELAFQDRLYRATKQLDLPLGSQGVSGVGLPPDVIDIEPGTVRLTDGTTETTLYYREEAELLRGNGPLFNAQSGTPAYYYVRAGAELGRQRSIILFPGSNIAREGGLLVGCWIYPDLMTNDSDTPAFQPAEHQWLIAQVVERMARLDRALGRADAPVGEARLDAQEAEDKLWRANQEARRDGPMRVQYEGDW